MGRVRGRWTSWNNLREKGEPKLTFICFRWLFSASSCNNCWWRNPEPLLEKFEEHDDVFSCVLDCKDAETKSDPLKIRIHRPDPQSVWEVSSPQLRRRWTKRKDETWFGSSFVTEWVRYLKSFCRAQVIAVGCVTATKTETTAPRTTNNNSYLNDGDSFRNDLVPWRISRESSSHLWRGDPCRILKHWSPCSAILKAPFSSCLVNCNFWLPVWALALFQHGLLTRHERNMS